KTAPLSARLNSGVNSVTTRSANPSPILIKSTPRGAFAAAQWLRPSARRERAALPGPLWRGGRVEESPQDGPQGCGPVFRRDRSPVEKPRNPPAHPQGRMPGGRAIGVSFPLGYFYFGQAKEKELGRRQA